MHWRSTARRGQLVVRELAEPARPSVDVVIAAGLWSSDALDRATVAAGAIAEDASQHGHPTTLAADGDRDHWREGLRDRLALLPPHVGAAARALRSTPATDADVTVRITHDGAAVGVTLDRDGHRTDLGTLPSSSDPATTASWLALRFAATAVSV